MRGPSGQTSRVASAAKRTMSRVIEAILLGRELCQVLRTAKNCWRWTHVGKQVDFGAPGVWSGLFLYAFWCEKA